jgi:8-oxo-dGTP pyrophosphatase MutT (NUDIX family)
MDFTKGTAGTRSGGMSGPNGDGPNGGGADGEGGADGGGADGGGADVVRAAGGIVTRQGSNGRLEVAVVHRPRREDWSLPKGKLEPGEALEAGALREVEEETGLRCRMGQFVGYTEYVDRRSRPKIVAYWQMEVLGGSFTPNQEVDEVRWLELDAAAELLTYARDRDVLSALGELALAASA